MENKNMDETISVIVPLYNAEKYVDQCVESLLNQTYKNLDIILINDGSNDGTEKKCKKYEKKYKFVKYFYKENGGEGSARNFGLTCCKSRFVTFLDCDDVLEKDAIEKLAFVINDKYQLIVGGIEKKENGILKRYIPNSKVIEGKKNIAISVIDDMYFLNIVVGKIFDMGIIRDNNIRFNNYKFGEDTNFMYQYLNHIENILFIHEVVYKVNITEGSMSLRQIPEIWEYMRGLYEYGITIDESNKYLKYMLCLRAIKTTLIIKAREGRTSFSKACEKINEFLKNVDLTVDFRKGLYNRLVIFLLNRTAYNSLYNIMIIRKILHV